MLTKGRDPYFLDMLLVQVFEPLVAAYRSARIVDPAGIAGLLELRHIRYFLAVAEEGHITRAAERLGMQQPPLSQQIRILERELGVQLLRRLPRGVELTSAGQAFRQEAEILVRQFELAQETARRAARGEIGTIMIGFTTSAPFHPCVPRVIRSFSQKHPGVSMILEENGSIDLITGLKQNKLDVAFIRTSVHPSEGLDAALLLEESMVVAFPKGHPLAGPATHKVSLNELSEEKFVGYRRPSGPGLYDSVIAACRSCGFSPRMGQDAPRMSSTLNLVAAGVGISIVPRSLERMKLDGISYRELAEAGIVAPIFLAKRKGPASPVVRKFSALARATVEEMSGQ